MTVLLPYLFPVYILTEFSPPRPSILPVHRVEHLVVQIRTLGMHSGNGLKQGRVKRLKVTGHSVKVKVG